MRREIWFSILLAFLLALLVVGDPPVSWRLQRAFFSGAMRAPSNGEQLVFENEVLRAELASLRDLKERLPSLLFGFIPAPVYSRYPFVLKNELLIGAGARDGVTSSTAVFLSVSEPPSAPSAPGVSSRGGIFIGYVSQVFARNATVRTVYDQEFHLPVRIGERGVEGLLQGGTEPYVGLIRKDEVINLGDIVYTAAPDAPYGYPVGRISRLRLSPDQIFTEAPLTFSYDLNTIHILLVARDYVENP